MRHLCMFALIVAARLGQAQTQAWVKAELRDIPVWCEVDVAVAGGSAAAVAAACAAADKGARVALVAPRPYLGDELCGARRLWLEQGEAPASELARALFPQGRVTTPLTVKRALDQALLRRGVKWLTGCYASDLLVDAQGRAAGLVAVTRSGSLAIRAKEVVDGTPQALLARQAGAAFRPPEPGGEKLRFVVVGGPLQAGEGLAGRTLDVTYQNPAGSKRPLDCAVYDYAFAQPGELGSYAAFARAEQALRDRACNAAMRDCSETAQRCPGETVIGACRLEAREQVGSPRELGAFCPQGVPRLYVLSACADASACAREALLRPLALLEAGRRVGEAAADKARSESAASAVRMAGDAVAGAARVAVGEPYDGVAPAARGEAVKAGVRSLPLLGAYDVVVVGGGTAGAPAGIAAARSGARTLVVEALSELGGVGTAGLIGSYWYGVRGGFTKEVDEAIGGKDRWSVVKKSEWLRRELGKAGADLWLGTLGCGALLEGRQVVGVVVATPFGRGAVRAKAVVDATGNADMAACAGAETEFGVAPGGMLSAQLAGLPPRNLGDNVNNTCFALVDDTSAIDVWHLAVWCRNQASATAPYDYGQLVDSRERRRVVADFMLAAPDILNHRSFPDTVSHHRSNFDAAAFPTSPMLLVKDMKGPAFDVDLPYRSLLPKGVDGLLVTGLGAGAERDAMTLIRMQSDVQNQGYAAGLAAAMAAQQGGHTRAVDVKALQRRLVEKGALEERVLAERDAYPLSRERIEQSVAEVGRLSREIKQSRAVEDPAIFSLAVVMAQPKEALPLLRQAYGAAAEGDAKLTYAKILGILGDATGASALVAALARAETWDKGCGLTSHRESDNTFSEQDRMLLALGYSGAPEAAGAVTAKLRQLTRDHELSHFIALAAVFRRQGPLPDTAQPLRRLLAELDAESAVVQAWEAGHPPERRVATTKPDTRLNAAFKGLLVAGMLSQSGGDAEGAGRRMLEQYAQGVEGHFARYARSVLATR